MNQDLLGIVVIGLFAIAVIVLLGHRTARTVGLVSLVALVVLGLFVWIGVSMGAVVGVTYALRRDWYKAILEMDTSAFPGPLHVRPVPGAGYRARLKAWAGKARVVRDMIYGWGPGTHALEAGRRLLHDLTGERRLEDSRIPLAVSTTDLFSGHRYVLRTGRAADALLWGLW